MQPVIVSIAVGVPDIKLGGEHLAPKVEDEAFTQDIIWEEPWVGAALDEDVLSPRVWRQWVRL